MDGFKTPRRKSVEARPLPYNSTNPQQAVATTPQPLPAPTAQATQHAPSLAQPAVESAASDIARGIDQPMPQKPIKRRWSLKKKLLCASGIALLSLVIAAVAAFTWYQLSLRPVSTNDSMKTRITIVKNSSPAQIGQLLHQKKLIRSTLAFDAYTRINQLRGKLQMGTYVLSPSLSLADIVGHLTSGTVDSYAITFFPGGTLTDYTNKPMAKRTDVQAVLLKAGFKQSEIDSALAATYASPLFAGKPAGASLEGYVYGETYTINSSMTATQVLQATFDEYYKQVQANDLVAALKAQGLSLYQGIIMASVVQSEMGSQAVDMPQVAQVFLKRYKEGTPLGSDVTAYYGADLTGKPRAVSVDTPYNTRIHVGLPKGPISSPGLAALRAVAQPAPGEYVYFLSGDDGTTYFAITNEQHEKNIVDHCKIGCSIP